MATSTPRYGYPIIEPEDHIRVSNRQAKLADDINRVSVRSESVAAGLDEKATSSLSTARNAQAAADEAQARNVLQNIALDAQELRIRALEALGSLDPGEVSDGTVASLVLDDESLSHEALGSAFVKRGTLVHDVRDYGAKGDNTTDDSAAFQAAIEAARVTRGRAFAYGTFRLDQPIVVNANADFGDAIVNYWGEGVALDVTGIRLHVTTPKELWNRNKTNGTGWDSVAGSVGVRTLNTNGCYIDIPFISNFETGLLNLGSNGGCAYNTMILGWLFNNKINQHLDTYTDTITGYSNQNTYIGGRWSHHAAEGTDIEGVYSLFMTGDGDGGPNSNVWVNPCLEGAQAQYAFNIERGRENRIINARLEFSNAARFGPGARDNEISVGKRSDQMEVVRDDALGSGYANNLNFHRFPNQYDTVHREWVTGQPHPWLEWNWGQRTLRLGSGTAEPLPIRGTTTSFNFGGTLRPDSDGEYDLGGSGSRWRIGFFSERVELGRNLDFYHAGTPVQSSDRVRLWAREHSVTGKWELCALFPSGPTQVIATEP